MNPIDKNTYPIYEMFHSFQGEGSHLGKSAFFVRTHGCPVKCDFCDSAGTWHPDYVPKEIKRYTAEQIGARAKLSGAEIVVITGGEPALFDLGPICGHCAPIHVHLETSGAYFIEQARRFEWIVVSPKRAKLPQADSIGLANEFKVIVEQPQDIEYFLRMLTNSGRYRGLRQDARPIWLHPEWSKRNDPLILEAIVSAVKLGQGTFRAGWQIHKLYEADERAEGSRPAVPLGGNPQKGV